MPIGGDKYAFIPDNVALAPDLQGVYALYQGDDLIYFGRADGDKFTIRSCLQSHLSGKEGPSRQKATHYSREESCQPIARQAELLEEFRQTYRRLPRCNARHSRPFAFLIQLGRHEDRQANSDPAPAPRLPSPTSPLPETPANIANI
jgi:hypothetical protein